MDRRSFLKKTAAGAAIIGLDPLAGCRPVKTAPNVKASDTFDTIIKNGSIYDGSGRKAFKGDLAILDGKVAAIGKNLGKNAGKLVDATGLAVSPGWIDIHSHTDNGLFVYPDGDSRILQGVTTELSGNCGDAPFVFGDVKWEQYKNETWFGGKSWRYVDGYFERLSQKGIGTNLSTLVGHNNLRRSFVGYYNVKATPEQLKRMCDVLDMQLSMGAAGLSFGLEYTPGCYADTEELIELCKVVAKHNALFSIHMRSEDDKVLEAVDEAIRMARESGARIEISHLKAQNPPNFDKLDAIIAKINQAKADGIDIAFDRYPYTAFSTTLSLFIPIALRDGSTQEIIDRMKDPKSAEIIKAHILNRLESYGGADKILILGCSKPENAAYSGKNIQECCEISGMEPWEMINHLLITERLNVSQATTAMSEDNLVKIYKHSLSMPGSDGFVTKPNGNLTHPRTYGTFPRLFQEFVREKKVIDLETAVYKCTALPASRIKLRDRGLLIPGYAADVTVFNPETIADVATYAKADQFPVGIEHVFVNGAHAVENGKITGEHNGAVIGNEWLDR